MGCGVYVYIYFQEPNRILIVIAVSFHLLSSYKKKKSAHAQAAYETDNSSSYIIEYFIGASSVTI